MAFIFGPYNSVNNDRLYRAFDMNNFFSGFVGEGVMATGLQGFFVVPTPEEEQIKDHYCSVIIKPGMAFLHDKWIINTEDYKLKLNPNLPEHNPEGWWISTIALYFGQESENYCEMGFVEIQGEPTDDETYTEEDLWPLVPDLEDEINPPDIWIKYYPLAIVYARPSQGIVRPENIEMVIGHTGGSGKYGNLPYSLGMLNNISLSNPPAGSIGSDEYKEIYDDWLEALKSDVTLDAINSYEARTKDIVNRSDILESAVAEFVDKLDDFYTNNYIVKVFYSSGSWTVPHNADPDSEILIYAAGGGGGGGGGAYGGKGGDGYPGCGGGGFNASYATGNGYLPTSLTEGGAGGGKQSIGDRNLWGSIYVVGGAGGGGGGCGGPGGGGGCGAAGGYGGNVTNTKLIARPGDTFSFSIGQGGAGGIGSTRAMLGTNGSSGGTTTVTYTASTILTVSGGSGGSKPNAGVVNGQSAVVSVDTSNMPLRGGNGCTSITALPRYSDQFEQLLPTSVGGSSGGKGIPAGSAAGGQGGVTTTPGCTNGLYGYPGSNGGDGVSGGSFRIQWVVAQTSGAQVLRSPIVSPIYTSVEGHGGTGGKGGNGGPGGAGGTGAIKRVAWINNKYYGMVSGGTGGHGGTGGSGGFGGAGGGGCGGFYELFNSSGGIETVFSEGGGGGNKGATGSVTVIQPNPGQTSTYWIYYLGPGGAGAKGQEGSYGNVGGNGSKGSSGCVIFAFKLKRPRDN